MARAQEFSELQYCSAAGSRGASSSLLEPGDSCNVVEANYSTCSSQQPQLWAGQFSERWEARSSAPRSLRRAAAGAAAG